MVRKPTFGPFVIHDGDELVIALDPSVIPPLDGGARLIAPNTLIAHGVAAPAGDGLVGDAFTNAIIEFPLDPSGIGGASETENDDNWGVGDEGVQASLFWDKGVNGAGVRIGIADSGLDSTHPAFRTLVAEERLVGYAQFDKLGNKELQRDERGVVVPDDKAIPSFSHWHGTHCAAILVGEPTEGKARGVAPGSELVVTRVLGASNEGSVAGILAGLSWLSTQDCDVVSLSLGWPGLHEEWVAPIKTLLQKGVVVVAAVGNEMLAPGVGKTRSPANYLLDPGSPVAGLLLAVGAHDVSGQVWDESGGELVDWSQVTVPQTDSSVRPSSFATITPRPLPTLVAPGVDIISATPGNSYRSSPGSSMATPHIAGLLALVLSALRRKDPAARPRTAADLLLKALKDLPPDGPDIRSGLGRANVPKLCTAVFG